MATRTIKFLGKAYSESGDVSLEVNINGTQVHNGTVTTKTPTGTEHTDDLYEMFTFSMDSSVSGNIPVSITVNGGTAHFGMLHGNYSGFDGIQNEDGTYTLTVAPEDYYTDLNSNTPESDGKTNVMYSNVDEDALEPLRSDFTTASINENAWIGDWQYEISDGATFTCDYYIDPAMEILEVPAKYL